MTAPHPTKPGHEQRVTTVHELLVAGLGRNQIVKYIAEKTNWGIRSRAVDLLIQKAAQVCRDNAIVDRRLVAGKALARLDDLFARCMRIQDYKAALAVQRELNHLIGLDMRWPTIEGEGKP